MKRKFNSLKLQEAEVMRKYEMSEPMSLEEISLALWMHEGKVKKPMTKMGIAKMLERIFEKLRGECKKRGMSMSDIRNLIVPTQTYSKTSCFSIADGNE